MHWKKGLVAILFAAGTLSAQEGWDSSFKLVLGHGNQAASDGAGASIEAGISIEGAYALPAPFGSLVFEGGYRRFHGTTAKDPAIPDPLPAGGGTFTGTDLQSTAQGWVGSALWRRALGPEGLYVEGGVRWSAFISRETWLHRTVTAVPGGGVSETGTATTGAFTHRGFGPLVGAGYRFDDLTSVDLHLSRQTVATATGGTRNLMVVELGLGTHF